MHSYPTLRRLLAVTATLVVFAAVLTAVAWSNRGADTENSRPEGPAADGKVWPMFGGNASRDMVNTFERNVPTEWSIMEGEEKHVKWTADLGDRAYGGPVIADGKVFVGTNNLNPRNP